MKKLIVQDAEIMQIALQQEILRSEEARYDNKLHGVLLVCSGMSCEDVGRVLGRGTRTIQYWVRRFNKNGFAGLREKEGRGRPCRLNEKEVSRISKDLRKNPRDLGYAQSIWDGKLLSHHVEAVFGKTVGVRQCQRLFRKLEFRFRKPRSVIANADPIAQKAFKKTPDEKTEQES